MITKERIASIACGIYLACMTVIYFPRNAVWACLEPLFPGLLVGGTTRNITPEGPVALSGQMGST